MEVRPYDQSVRGVPVKYGSSLCERAWDNTKPGINGCWESLLAMHKHGGYILKQGNKRISQLLVLWWVHNDSEPVGQLSNACGDTRCVNPDHYLDHVGRFTLWNDREWARINVAEPEDVLRDLGIDEEDGYSFQVYEYDSPHNKCGLGEAGMTRMFCCYHCNAVFDPMKSRNPVVCDDCWTDEDQAQSEEEE